MLDSKTRAKLKGMASALSATFQIGKNALSDNLIASLADALSAHELIKITVLKSCEYDSEQLSRLLEMKLRAECVTTIGSKIILYRKSHKEGVKHIL